jgi:hypothetical protein
MKHSNLYLGLVLPSGGWQSLIEESKFLNENEKPNGLETSAVHLFSENFAHAVQSHHFPTSATAMKPFAMVSNATP